MGILIFINGDGPFDIRCVGMLAGGIHDLFPAQIVCRIFIPILLNICSLSY